jgi:hypothetical protein
LADDETPKQIILELYILYKNNSISVKMGKEHSEWKPINCGV